jgi:hypothetical protein
MYSQLRVLPRILAMTGTMGAALLLIVAPRPAAAQGDPRWQAWVGCWEAADASGMRVIGSPTAPMVCAVPASGTSAVDIMTVISGKIVDRTHVDASGTPRANTKDGCNGSETATWSKSATRVYVHSDYTCPGGIKRTTNGLMALSPDGEWLEIQRVASGTNKGIRVVRMREATNLSAVPAEITTALQGHTLATSASRVAASAMLTGEDLIDAARNVDAAVMEAWIVERNQGFTLSPKVLTTLADAGLPDSVIDVMVAMTYPKVFALNPATGTGEFRAADNSQRAYNGRGRQAGVLGYDAMGYPLLGYSSYFGECAMPYYGSYYSYFDRYSSYLGGCGYNGFGYSAFGYPGFGFGGYGYGYGYGWYPGPIVVVKGGDTGSGGPPPRVVNGHGYSQGGSGSSGTAKPSSSSGSGSSASTSSTSSSASSSSSAPARTAHPKP